MFSNNQDAGHNCYTDAGCGCGPLYSTKTDLAANLLLFSIVIHLYIHSNLTLHDRWLPSTIEGQVPITHCIYAYVTCYSIFATYFETLRYITSPSNLRLVACIETNSGPLSERFTSLFIHLLDLYHRTAFALSTVRLFYSSDYAQQVWLVKTGTIDFEEELFLL